jgi:hypothetical protein
VDDLIRLAEALRLKNIADLYLVMSGPRAAAASSRGASRPWVTDNVPCSPKEGVVRGLRERGRGIGIASGAPARVWDAAEIHPAIGHRSW